MTEAELARRIRLGEDSALEVKSVAVDRGRVTAPDKRDLADELAAFANSRGGTMLLGVEDGSRRIPGIPLDELDAVETWVRDLCNDAIRPALDAHILKLELADGDGRLVPLLRIDIERSQHVPGGLVNTLTPDSLHLRQANRNELIVSLLARCAAPSGLGRTRLMDRRGDGVPIIRRECEALSGRIPEYSLIEEDELHLVIWAAK